jgi:hypothetical protein
MAVDIHSLVQHSDHIEHASCCWTIGEWLRSTRWFEMIYSR